MCTKIHYSNQVCFSLAARRKSWLITHRWRGSGGGAGSGHRGLAAPAEPRLQDRFKEKGGAQGGLFKVTNPAHKKTSKWHPRETQTHQTCEYETLPRTEKHTRLVPGGSRDTALPLLPRLSAGLVWKYFKQTGTSPTHPPYIKKEKKLEDALRSIPAGLIRIVLNSRGRTF